MEYFVCIARSKFVSFQLFKNGGDILDIFEAVHTEDELKNFKNNLLDLDATFNFKCRKCGKCCKNQDTILFSPRDIFKIAQKYETQTLEIIKSYTEVYIGRQSQIPVVHLLMQGKKNACPFLSEEGHCSIHDIKPTVCALYPLGRVIIEEKNEINVDAKNVVRYIMSGQCGSVKKQHTVRNWLADFGIPENDEFFLLWSRVTIKLSETIQKIKEKGVSQNVLEGVWWEIFFRIFIAYDLERDFLSQFLNNIKLLFVNISSFQKEI